MNASNTASSQEGNLHPTMMTKAEAANQNNCYLVYISLANSGQVIMPALMTDGNNAVRMISQFSPQRDSNGHLPGVGNLPVRISSSVVPLPVSSVCNSQTDLMTGQSSQDKSKPRVAVVVPYSDSCANNYRPDGPQATDSMHNHQNLRNVSSVAICQSGNSQQQQVTPLRSHPERTGLQQSALQHGHIHSVAASPGLQNSARPLQGIQSSNTPTRDQQPAKQQITSADAVRQQCSSQQNLRLQSGLHQVAGSQQLLVQQLQRAQLNQLLAGQQLLGKHGCSQQALLQHRNIQQLSSGGQNIQTPRHVRAGCLQVRAEQGRGQPFPLPSQCAPVHPAMPQPLSALRFSGSPQLPQHNANQLTAQQKNFQQFAQSPDNSHVLPSQRLAQPQLCLGIMPALNSSQAVSPQPAVQSRVQPGVQPGVSQQLMKQNNTNQSLALLLANYEHLNAGAAMLPRSVNLQAGNCQLMKLQQHILQQGCNASQLELKQFGSRVPSTIAQLLSNLQNQLPNGSCMQSDNKQQLLQQQYHQLPKEKQQLQHQLLQRQKLLQHQQQLLQQQQLFRVGDAVHGNSLMAEKKIKQENCDSENGSVTLPSQCASVLNCAGQNSEGGAVASGNDKCMDLNRGSDTGCTRVDVPQRNSTADDKGARTAPCENSFKSCLPIHSANQQLQAFNRCLNNSVQRQNLSVNHSVLGGVQLSASCPGAVGGFKSSFPVAVAKQQVSQTHGFAVADRDSCNIGRNLIAESKGPAGNQSLKFSSTHTTVGMAFSPLLTSSIGVSLSGVTSSGNSQQNSATVDSQAAEHSSRSGSVVNNSMHNSVSLSGNFVPHGICSPSTIVCLRMALPPGRNLENDCNTKPQTSHAEQAFLQNYPPVGVTGQVLALHSSSTSSITDQLVSSQRLPAASIGVQISPASGTSNDVKIQQLPVKHNSAAKVFFNVMHSESNISSVSSCNLTSPTEQLEKGQECELRYGTGQRLMAVWDGKYFKVKTPLCSNQDSDSANIDTTSDQPSVKDQEVVLKDGQENSTSDTSSGLRPSLHQGIDVLSKSTEGDVTFMSGSVSSVMSAPAVPLVTKRPREEGKFAVCTHCGAFSCDYDHCDQCRRSLPPDVKLYDPKRPKTDVVIRSSVSLAPSAEIPTGKQSRMLGDLVLGARRPTTEGNSKISPRALHSGAKAIPASQKLNAKRTRKQEAEIVHILSSDEEGDDSKRAKISSNARMALAACVPHKAKKFKSESLSGDTIRQEPKTGEPGCRPPNGETGDSNCRLQNSQSIAKMLDPLVLTANVLHAFFGFIRYESKCCLILQRNMMSLQPVGNNDVSSLTVTASEIRMVAGHINRAKCLNCLFVLVSAGKASDISRSVKHDANLVFNPESNEDCAKYIVLFLDEQRSEFLSDIEIIVNQMTGTGSASKPQYKRIDNFDVEKYLQTVCPNEDLGNFIRISSKSADALQTGGQTPVNMQRNIEKEEDADYGSCSHSPVHALFPGQIIKLFTYPPPPATGGITVTNEDLFCLNEGEFLNDVIIDFYLKYLATEFLSDKFQRTHIFSSFFYRRLTQKPSRKHKEEEDVECASIQQRRHSRIRTWTRHVDIFEKDFLIVPINESSHWYLAIICYPGLTSPEFENRIQPESTDETSEMNSRKAKSKGRTDSPKKSENTFSGGGRKGRVKTKKTVSSKSKTEQCMSIRKMPCVLVFDSLAGPARNAVIRNLREYLQVEWDVKKKETLGSRAFTKDNMKGASPECPQQSNFSDCGVYVLQYVESFFTNPIEDYTFPLKLVGNWFNEEKVKNKRFGLQQLIIEMQLKYNPTLEYNPETDGCLVKRETEELSSNSAISSQAAVI